jgi:hypothetical protein
VKAIGEKTTIVLAGAFNPAILTPPWVATHGLGYASDREFAIEMLAPVGGTGVPRFNFDGLSYSAAYNVVTAYVPLVEPARCSQAVDVFAKILEQLPHTPVAGLGFNFAFQVDGPSAEFRALATPCVPMEESFGEGSTVAARKWGNIVKWEDALVSVECDLAGDQATVSFNFHHSTASAQAAVAVLRTDGVYEKHMARAVAAASALTGQQLET